MSDSVSVLICDDDLLLLELLTHRLTIKGYAVETASDGREAWEKHLALRPTAVVLDVTTPLVNGLELLQRIREHDELHGTPVLMLTARKQEQDIVGAIDLGASDFLSKPFIPEDGTGNIPQWFNYGGMQTLESYGLSRSDLFRPEFDLKSWAADNFPDQHRRFLENLRDSYQRGDFLFVHAGIRPGVALHEQSAGDLRWIRSDFLEDGRDHGAMVVHGHTISRDADERDNRIGVDTGCYLSGKLTALVLEGSGRRFMDTRRSKKR